MLRTCIFVLCHSILLEFMWKLSRKFENFRVNKLVHVYISLFSKSKVFVLRPRRSTDKTSYKPHQSQRTDRADHLSMIHLQTTNKPLARMRATVECFSIGRIADNNRSFLTKCKKGYYFNTNNVLPFKFLQHSCKNLLQTYII